MKINFGKYKGKTINWIKNNDSSYYDWGCKNIPDVFLHSVKKNIKINESDTILNYINPCDSFKWHNSYPNDMKEKLWKWFKS